MRAAIYARVSTEGQEREGTSLDSQLEACRQLAQERNYDVPGEFIVAEAYSGLSLNRPELDRIRQWAREGQIDAVIVYTLDRLSRNPVHFIILQDELERSGVEIILVTETLDSSDLGKLITYIKGYAAKLEAGKIRERTMRGIMQRVKSGKLPSGRRGRLYGYEYLQDSGTRRIDESEAQWVRRIFQWFVNEGIGIDRITYKLRELNVPTPSGAGLWYSSEVWRILKTTDYIGQTYVFKMAGRKRKPKAEWTELPGVTPAIIDNDLFTAAQAQLERNKVKASRNTKQPYLLSGHILCQRCNRRFWGFVKRVKWSGQRHIKRYYRCAGNLQMVSPIRCGNRNLQADKIENMVWLEVEGLLSNPQLVLEEIQRKMAEIGQDGLLKEELNQVEKRLRSMNKEQERLLQWALKGFPEEQIIKENEKINQARIQLEGRKVELERKIEATEQVEFDVQGIERFCELARRNLSNFTYADKRLALEALQIRVLVDGDVVSMTGAIPIMPIMTGDIVTSLPA
jgi:site-specific DNA recombinase